MHAALRTTGPSRPAPLAELASRSPRARLLAFIASLGAAAAVLHGAPRTAHADVSSWFTGGGGTASQRSESRDDYNRATALSLLHRRRHDADEQRRRRRARPVDDVLHPRHRFRSLGARRDRRLRARAVGARVRHRAGLAQLGERADYGALPAARDDRRRRALGPAARRRRRTSCNLDGGTSSQGAVALLEINLLRLTVMRQGATDRWWENPSPAGGRVR